MEARSIVAPSEPPLSAQPTADSPVTVDQVSVTNTPQTPTQATGVLPRRPRGRSAVRVEPLPRNVEFAYIRSDMRRLLAIAGGLLVLMLLLLVVLGR